MSEKIIRRKIIKRPINVPVDVPVDVPVEKSVILRRVYAIASDILGDSFRPHENNLKVGKIVIPPELIAKWESKEC
jgi:hypothetical protein